MAKRSFLGTGIKYPHEVDQFGRIKLISGTALIEQSIKILLQTPIGADFDNPSRGSRINQLLFQPNDDILESLLDFYIFEAIDQWEKRVEFLDTEFEYESSRPDLVLVTVTYRIKANNDIESLVYPFYRQINA